MGRLYSLLFMRNIRNGTGSLRKLNKPFSSSAALYHTTMETRSGIPLGTKPLTNHPVSWNEDEQILVCLPTIVQILVSQK